MLSTAQGTFSITYIDGKVTLITILNFYITLMVWEAPAPTLLTELFRTNMHTKWVFDYWSGQHKQNVTSICANTYGNSLKIVEQCFFKQYFCLSKSSRGLTSWWVFVCVNKQLIWKSNSSFSKHCLDSVICWGLKVVMHCNFGKYPFVRLKFSFSLNKFMFGIP